MNLWKVETGNPAIPVVLVVFIAVYLRKKNNRVPLVFQTVIPMNTLYNTTQWIKYGRIYMDITRIQMLFTCIEIAIIVTEGLWEKVGFGWELEGNGS